MQRIGQVGRRQAAKAMRAALASCMQGTTQNPVFCPLLDVGGYRVQGGPARPYLKDDANDGEASSEHDGESSPLLVGEPASRKRGEGASQEQGRGEEAQQLVIIPEGGMA